jgi:hypothetical protein
LHVRNLRLVRRAGPTRGIVGGEVEGVLRVRREEENATIAFGKGKK